MWENLSNLDGNGKVNNIANKQGGPNKSLWSSLQPKLVSHKLRFLSHSFSIPKNSKLLLTNFFFTDSSKSTTSI